MQHSGCSGWMAILDVSFVFAQFIASGQAKALLCCALVKGVGVLLFSDSGSGIEFPHHNL